MSGAQTTAKRVGVLIDADNVPPSVLDAVMRAAAKRGVVVVACAYRHWTEATRKGWDAGTRKHGIVQVEQAPGPNATDIALAIDAVDLVRDRGLDVVCVVSGDRDFAPLAARLRRARLNAVLMADPAKVKDSNRALWEDFVELAVAAPKPVPAPKPAAATKPAPAPAPARPDAAKLAAAVRARFDDSAVKIDADGWARLNEVGKTIDAALKKPSLRKALHQTTGLEIEDRPFGGRGAATACIRLRSG